MTNSILSLLPFRRFVPVTVAACWVSFSASATIYTFDATLNGASESPANASPGTGFGTANYDSIAHTLHLQLTFSGLTGTTTASHIHSPTLSPFSGTAGVATTTPYFTGFPIGVTSGTFDSTLDLTATTSYNSTYLTANGGSTATAEASLTASMLAGTAYWNVHTTTFGGGEIRGFFVLVPEPSSLALLALGGTALALFTRRCAKA